MVKGPVYMVRGNCDTYSSLRTENVFRLHGHKIAMTHGHNQHVERGVDVLKYWALQNEADVVLYGHHACAVCRAEQSDDRSQPGQHFTPASKRF